LCRWEGINPNVYYRWSKDFMEAGKKWLSGDVVRKATSDEVKALWSETAALKETLDEMVLENRLLKKSVIGHGADDTWDILLLRNIKSFNGYSIQTYLFDKR
jgi:transposase